MKRYAILGGITVVALAVLLCLSVLLPTAVKTVTVTAQTAVKTALCPARVTDNTHLQVAIRESLAATVKPGQAVTVRGVGFRKEAYRGTVAAVDNTATTQNGKTVLFGVITLSDTDDSLKPGLSATARITVNTVENAVVVKDPWTHSDARGTFVWTIRDGRARQTYVSLGDAVDGGTLAAELPVGTRVILSPASLSEGKRIREVTP